MTSFGTTGMLLITGVFPTGEFKPQHVVGVNNPTEIILGFHLGELKLTVESVFTQG